MPKETPEKLDLRSMDITDEKKRQLKQLFPEVFREDKVDFDHLKRVLGEWVDPGKERFGLQWPGKADCMKTIQQPSIATLRPDREESVNFDETENLFIEGDNLEVLKLLQKSYFGKVKMIYIDPPYNTGNEFIYPDNYTESLDTYLKYTGQKDEEGNWQSTNRDTEGRFHSKWLNMMYPRLFLAKNLLKDDGAIFISIDDHEMANLKKLCDDIYGQENYIGQFPWRKRTAKSDVPFGVSQDYEWVIGYAKNELIAGLSVERKYHYTEDFGEDGWRLSDLTNQRSAEERPNSAFNMVDPKTGKEYPYNPKRVWAVSKDTFQDYYDKGKIVFPDDYDFLNITIPSYRVFESEDREKALKKYGTEEPIKAASTHLPKYIGMNEDGNKEMVELFGYKIFSFPKPSSLIKHFIDIIHDKEAIILDFFAGSCSTAHAVLKQNQEDDGNRKFVMVQLPEPTEEKSEAKKAGFDTIADIGKERIRRVIEQIKEAQKENKQLELGEDGEKKNEQDLGFKVFKLTPSNFKVWEAPGVDIDPEELKAQLDAFSDHLNPENEEESILFELILKSGFPLTANIEKIVLEGKNVFNVENGKLMICLAEELTFEVLDAISEKEPQRVICLDNGFTGDDADALKTNAVQLFKSKEIEFRTV